MDQFNFSGQLTSSKSLMNRALVVQSFYPELSIYGQSSCDDVVAMRSAIRDFTKGQNKIECKAAGTVLRFMALRVAREKGEFLLTGESQLFKRLPEDLIQLLSQLGAKAQLTNEGLLINSIGWKVMGDALHLQAKLSSQFASAVFLSAWDYPLDLFISVPRSMLSRGYFQMTIDTLVSLGMQIFSNQGEYHIPKKQILKSTSYVCELDLSSCFALAAAATLAGQAKVQFVPDHSLQPDVFFFDILDEMQIDYDQDENTLQSHFFQQTGFEGLDCDLGETPDLFPVLAVLAAFAKGTSHLYGAKHLSHKESDRIAQTCELLRRSGCRVTQKEDGAVIEGNPLLEPTSFSFDAHNDHRMAMAAGLLMLKGFQIDLQGRESVNKSFPEFWDIIKK